MATGPDHNIVTTGFFWKTIVSAVIFSTIHVQDMQDQAGDSAKGRRSAPIMLGDYTARWTIVVLVLFSSLFCPLYWAIGVFGWLLPMGVGTVIAARELWFREPEADHTTWVIWGVWLLCLYLLPVINHPDVLMKYSGAFMNLSQV